VLEDERAADLIVIAFPSRAHAEAWYRSPAYQALLPLRTRNSRSDVILNDGVEEGHACPGATPDVLEAAGELAVRAVK